MDTLPQSPSVNARSLLLPYALSLIGAMLGVQIVIAVTGSEITLLSGVLTALVAFGIVLWLWRSRAALRHVRFGAAIAHTIAFVTVTTSFNLHALIVLLSLGVGGPDDAFGILMGGSSWFGATLVMSSAWGLGLLVHLIGSVLGRGWDD